jgi:methylglutaconyl-CoA hydratase
MDYEHIRVEAGAIAKVVLCRPEARNAMSEVTLKELTHAFKALAKDEGVRAVLVTGEGKDFCAGADINWMRAGGQMAPEEGKKDARLFADMLRAVDECPVPVVVAAQGNVFGGGLGLLAACDVALIADNAKMSFSEVRLGIMPAVISCWVLPKIGIANARRYYLTAEVFDAAQALWMNLVHEVVPIAELETRAEAIATKVLLCAPGAVRTAKALIPKLAALPLDARIDLTVDTLVKLRSGPEGQEGLSAFLEKRAAKWAPKWTPKK